VTEYQRLTQKTRCITVLCLCCPYVGTQFYSKTNDSLHALELLLSRTSATIVDRLATENALEKVRLHAGKLMTG
jgi:hypothetical protein